MSTIEFRTPGALVQALHNAQLFASKDDTYPSLASARFVYTVGEEKTLVIYSTDRYRACREMAEHNAEDSAAESATFLLPRSSINLLLKALKSSPKTTPVSLTVEHDGIVVESHGDGAVYRHQTLPLDVYGDSFPNLDAVFDRHTRPEPVSALTFQSIFLADLCRVKTGGRVQVVRLTAFGLTERGDPTPVLAMFPNGPEVLILPVRESR